MHIQIENYRGIKAAAFPLEGIALIAASNAAGKSAIAQATGAVLAGEPVPIPGVLKSMAGMLVRNGASKGVAVLTDDTGASQVEWPRATLKTKGTPPQASAIAAGIELLTPAHGAVDTPALQKRRAELMIDLLQAAPTIDDLRARLSREGVSDEIVNSLWETIERNGWDASHNQAKETGARLKGQWEAITGDRYGSKKAETYVPANWEPELASASESSLTAAMTDARDTLDGMIAVDAVADAERDRLQALSDALPGLEEEITAAQQALTAATSTATKRAEELRALPNPNSAPASQACPHCGGALFVLGGSIGAPREFTDADRDAYAKAEGLLSSARDVHNDARSAVANIEVRKRDALAAADQLRKINSGNTTREELDRARNAVQVAQQRLDAFQKKTRADRLQNSVVQNLAIVAALDMSGVRQDKLNESVKDFLTTRAHGLSAAASWCRIDINSDMSLTYGERDWALLSESERYRVRVLLQVAIAQIDGSRAVVIDAADILDKAGRNGLIKMLRQTGIPALVCMTIPTPNDVPDLAKPGIGESWWIADGELVRLSTALQGKTVNA